MTSPEPPDQNSPTSGLPSYGSFDPPAGATPPPPPGGGNLPPAPGGYGPPAAPNNKKALWSLILGIVSILCCGIFAGIPAIILSSMAKKEIVASGGREGGSGMATAGLILGILSIVISVLSVILFAGGVFSGGTSGSFDSGY